MEKWRTQIQVEKASVSINHDHQSIFLGSCFSENIANKFMYYGLRAQKNPLGIIYNPISIVRQLRLLLEIENLDESRFIQRQNHFFHLDAHSDFYANTKEELSKKWNSLKHNFKKLWAKADFVFITLGTSWIYEHIETNYIVANCHKIPTKEFNKRLLNTEEITSALKDICTICEKADKPKNIVFTVSPVRHTKDGLIENSLSKAQLISSIHQVLSETKGRYFPAYEIMIDDLRDYRFYANDMIHPSEKAIDYIWNVFKEVFFEDKTTLIGEEISKIRAMKSHRPMFPDSDEHKMFLQSLESKIEKLYGKYPELKYLKI